MKIKCEYCWKSFDVREELIGQSIKCKFCERTITVKAPSSTKKDTSNITKMIVQDVTVERGVMTKSMPALLGAILLCCIINIILTLTSTGAASKATNAKTPGWARSLNQNMRQVAMHMNHLMTAMQQWQEKYTGEKGDLDLVKTTSSISTEFCKAINEKLLPSFRLIADQVEKLHTALETRDKHIKKSHLETTKLLEKIQKNLAALATKLNQLQSMVPKRP